MAGREEMKEYLIVTAHPALPAHIRAQGPTIGEAWKKAAHRNALMLLAREIEQKVTVPHGGQILTDGSGYGVAGSPGQFNDMIRVKTTAKGLEALKEIGAVGRISEAIDFNNLKRQPDGVSNVPPGVCWTQPNPKP